MEVDDSEQREISCATDPNHLNNITEELYIHKHYLLRDGRLAPDAMSHLCSIGDIILDFPELNKSLFDWNFLENEILYFLRGSGFKQAIEIATRILTVVNRAPNLYFTKKFMFFITEKLYSAMSGQSIVNREIIMADPSQNPFRSVDPVEFNINDTIRLVMLFIKKLVEINKEVVKVLNDIMFFELANTCICIEAAQMFNAVFVGASFFENASPSDSTTVWKTDGIYEIRRAYFEPEVIFREKDIFNPIASVENLRSAVLNQIYDQCTNILNFADLSFKDTADLMLYKRITYRSSELEVFLLEAKDPKAIRFYRRSLEAGYMSEPTYLNSIVKAVDNHKTSLDASIILYYLRSHIVNFKLFTEVRLRRIIENLEYRCGIECGKTTDSTQHVTTKMSRIAQNKTVEFSLDENFSTNILFTEGHYHDGPAEISDEKQIKSVLDDFSEFDNGEEFVAEESEHATGMYCDSYRILKLIQHIYPHINRRVFFKPSYLILFRSSLAHVPEMRSFILEFFDDFISFLKLDRLNIARLFVPVNQNRSRMVELRLEKDNEVEIAIEQTPYTIMEFDEEEKDAHNLRVNRGIIESDDEM